MADNTGRDEGEEAMFALIRSPSPPDDQNEGDDGSQYLNNTREGDMIFDREDRIDEVQNYDDDLEIANTGEVILYIYIKVLRIEQIVYRE